MPFSFGAWQLGPDAVCHLHWDFDWRNHIFTSEECCICFGKKGGVERKKERRRKKEEVRKGLRKYFFLFALHLRKQTLRRVRFLSQGKRCRRTASPHFSSTCHRFQPNMKLGSKTCVMLCCLCCLFFECGGFLFSMIFYGIWVSVAYFCAFCGFCSCCFSVTWRAVNKVVSNQKQTMVMATERD